jgi:hypothetical protein
LNYLESEGVQELDDPKYNLKTLEISLAAVLTVIVEALPTPTSKQVKQLLGAREQLWNALYPPDPDVDAEESIIGH